MPGLGVEEVGGGDVERDRDVAAQLEPAGEHGLEDVVDGLGVGPEPRAVTPLVADEVRLRAPLS